jgi:hypothetical protein
MIEQSEKQAPEKEYREPPSPPGAKHYACTLCHEKYELTDEQHRKLTCCGLPVQRTEEIVMSSPEPFGP